MYNWTLPTVDTLKATGFQTYNGDQFARCVVRLRYNVSTDDYDPYNTDATTVGVKDPLTLVTLPAMDDNPTVDIGAQYVDYGNQPAQNNRQWNVEIGLQLALDTTQFGR